MIATYSKGRGGNLSTTLAACQFLPAAPSLSLPLPAPPSFNTGPTLWVEEPPESPPLSNTNKFNAAPASAPTSPRKPQQSPRSSRGARDLSGPWRKDRAAVSPVRYRPKRVVRLPPELRQAVYDGDLRTVQRHVVGGKHANAVEEPRTNTTLLFIAAQQGHESVVKHLLREGARPEEATRSGTTPLHVSAWHGHAGVVRSLLARGAESGGTQIVHRTSQSGDMPVHAAVARGHETVARLLVDAGARLDVPGGPQSGNHSKAPLFLAVDAADEPMVELLADTIVAKYGYTSHWVLRQPWIDALGTQWTGA